MTAMPGPFDPSPTRRALAVALLAAVLAAAATYALFASSGTPTTLNVTSGEQRNLALSHGEADRHELAWSTNVTLEDSPTGYDVTVVLPYTIMPSPPPAEGARVWTNVTVNGDPASQHLFHQAHGEVTIHNPGPLIDTDPFREGVNRIAAEATIERTADAEGSANVTIGPLLTRVDHRDADADGVADPHQPVEGLHTGGLAGLVGLGLALPVGYAAWWLGTRGEAER